MKKYESKLRKVQKEILFTEEIFQKQLRKRLNLEKIKGPLFIEDKTGINDNLSGVEKPVIFKHKDHTLEVVHSLAKWKRMALKEYGFEKQEGLYVEMSAIRADEEKQTKYHSLYVDQYDWEKHITKRQRSLDFLFKTVNDIYKSIRKTKQIIMKKYKHLEFYLPKKIKFISSEKLLKQFPNLTSEEREKEIVKKYGVVFVYGIGHELKNNETHGLRAPDYDDWKLNGDLIVWDHKSEDALELSSMGIRVDASSLKKQMELKDKEYKEFHKSIDEKQLPLSIGGGIGKSRLNMFLLEKRHIGEVQSSFWSEKHREEWFQKDVYLLK